MKLGSLPRNMRRIHVLSLNKKLLHSNHRLRGGLATSGPQ